MAAIFDAEDKRSGHCGIAWAVASFATATFSCAWLPGNLLSSISSRLPYTMAVAVVKCEWWVPAYVNYKSNFTNMLGICELLE